MNLPALNISLIDSDQETYDQLKRLLSSSTLQYHIEWCKTYEEGLVQLEAGTHDVYIINYELGGASGVELILEAERTYRSRTIIIISSVSNESWEKHAIENGASDYLEKKSLTAIMLERSIRYARSRSINYRLLKEQRAKYLTLFQQSIDPIILCHLNFEVYEYNEAFLQLINEDGKKSKSIDLASFIINDTVLKEFKNTISENVSLKNYELQISTEKGIKDCLLNVAPIKDELSKLVGYQIIIHDITQIRKEAIANREQDRISYTGKLAQLIAHEVRNPLTNINLAVGQLSEIKQPEPEERSIYFDIIQRNSARINDLISQLLDSSKPSVLTKELFSLGKVISNAIDFCADRIHLQNVQLLLDIANQDKHFQLDHEKMEIALLNIMTNALEAMSNQEHPKLAVNLNYTANHAVISIQDNGKGMSQEQSERIFEPFYTGRVGGKGLGMTLSKNIINSHKGEIKIVSELGLGTTFMITIPTN